jgi:UDP-glucose 4-epimerase
LVTNVITTARTIQVMATTIITNIFFSSSAMTYPQDPLIIHVSCYQNPCLLAKSYCPATSLSNNSLVSCRPDSCCLGFDELKNA